MAVLANHMILLLIGSKKQLNVFFSILSFLTFNRINSLVHYRESLFNLLNQLVCPFFEVRNKLQHLLWRVLIVNYWQRHHFDIGAATKALQSFSGLRCRVELIQWSCDYINIYTWKQPGWVFFCRMLPPKRDGQWCVRGAGTLAVLKRKSALGCLNTDSGFIISSLPKLDFSLLFGPGSHLQ